MFLETFSARLPPPLAARLPRGRSWDPCPQSPVPTGHAGLDRGPPGPAGTLGLAPRSAAPAAARAPRPSRPPRGRCGSDVGSGEPLCVSPTPSPRVAFLTSVRAGPGRARGKDFKLSIERVSVLFLIKSFFKWWRWPKFHTIENKERHKGCVGAARARGAGGGVREALTQASTRAVRGNIFCFKKKKY